MVLYSGAVTRFSLVITSEIRISFDSRNRRSRRVRMPLSLPFIVMGTPRIPLVHDERLRPQSRPAEE